MGGGRLRPRPAELRHRLIEVRGRRARAHQGRCERAVGRRGDGDARVEDQHLAADPPGHAEHGAQSTSAAASVPRPAAAPRRNARSRTAARPRKTTALATAAPRCSQRQVASPAGHGTSAFATRPDAAVPMVKTAPTQSATSPANDHRSDRRAIASAYATTITGRTPSVTCTRAGCTVAARMGENGSTRRRPRGVYCENTMSPSAAVWHPAHAATSGPAIGFPPAVSTFQSGVALIQCQAPPRFAMTVSADGCASGFGRFSFTMMLPSGIALPARLHGWSGGVVVPGHHVRVPVPLREHGLLRVTRELLPGAVGPRLLEDLLRRAGRRDGLGSSPFPCAGCACAVERASAPAAAAIETRAASATRVGSRILAPPHPALDGHVELHLGRRRAPDTARMGRRRGGGRSALRVTAHPRSARPRTGSPGAPRGEGSSWRCGSRSESGSTPASQPVKRLLRGCATGSPLGEITFET